MRHMIFNYRLTLQDDCGSHEANVEIIQIEEKVCKFLPIIVSDAGLAHVLTL